MVSITSAGHLCQLSCSLGVHILPILTGILSKWPQTMKHQNQGGVKTTEASRQGLKGDSSFKLGVPDTPLCFHMPSPLAGSHVQSGLRARYPQFATAGVLMVRVQQLSGGISSSGLALVGDGHSFQLGMPFHLELN